MNDIIRSLNDRKSVRAFEEREIPADIKRAILNAAMQAPTAGNQQMYTILDITDQNIKDQLVKSCDDQPFIAKAKMVLIFLADYQKWYDAFVEGGAEPRKPGCGDLLLACSDAVIAAQNAVVAAESFGIGSCYIGDVMENCEIHREMLNLPEYVFPACMLVFGYPTDQQKERKKPERCRLEDIVQEILNDPELLAEELDSLLELMQTDLTDLDKESGEKLLEKLREHPLIGEEKISRIENALRDAELIP